MPALRLGGSLTFSVFKCDLTSTPRSARLEDLHRLLLRLHDVGQRHVARLVQAQVGGHDRGQLDLERLETAVDLARDVGEAVTHLDLRGERRLRHVGERGQHLAGLVAVVVDSLLAEDHEARLLLVDQRLQQLGDRQRLQLVVALDQDRPVGADRHRRAQRLLALLDAARNRDHFGHDALLLQPHGLLDSDLVERVHAHLDVGDIHAGAIGLHADLDVVVNDTLYGDENLHRAAPARGDQSNERAILATAAPAGRSLTPSPVAAARRRRPMMRRSRPGGEIGRRSGLGQTRGRKAAYGRVRPGHQRAFVSKTKRARSHSCEALDAGHR